MDNEENIENTTDIDTETKPEETEQIEKKELILASEDWGLHFGEEGTQPVGNASAADLKAYHSYYVGEDSEKVIYLTFDCGYENGNTEPILDALKSIKFQQLFCGRTFSGDRPRLGEAHGIGRTYGWKPYLSSP